MSSAVLASKARNDTQKGLLLPQEASSSLFGFSPLFILSVLMFLGVVGSRPGSTAPMSCEGSRFPDTCDLHTSFQTAARHLQPWLRTQTAPSCSGSLFPHQELLLGKMPSKTDTQNPRSHPGHAPQHACGLFRVCFPGLKIKSLGKIFRHTRKADL